MDPVSLGALIGAGAALSGIVLRGVGAFARDVFTERTQRKLRRQQSLGLALSHLLEVRSTAVAQVGMRKTLGEWVIEAGGSQSDADQVFAFSMAHVSLPDAGPAYSAAVEALATDFPVLAFRMRNKNLAVESRGMFAQLPPQLAAHVHVAALAVFSEAAIARLDELALDIAGRMDADVLADVKKTLADSSPDAMSRDPEFVRYLEEIRVRMQTLATTAGALKPPLPPSGGL